MTPEPPAPTPRRKRRFLRWLGVLLLGYFAYAAWKEYDYRAAVKEAQALGWQVRTSSPFEYIKKDWHAAITLETWMQARRTLEIEGQQDFFSQQHLILRLNPQQIGITKHHGPLDLSVLKHLPDLRLLQIMNCPEMTDANMDQIQELTTLRMLIIVSCPRLTHVNLFSRLEKLEWLRLWDVPFIPQSDIDAFKAAHPNTHLDTNP